MRLLGVEMRRGIARRLTKGVFIFCIAGVIAAGVSVFFASKRETIHSVAHGPKIVGFVQACTSGLPLPLDSTPPLPAVGTPDRATACQNLADQLTENTIDKRFYLRNLPDILKHVSAMAAIVAWLLGASFIGGEWRSGSFATLLTWEPRRTRVMIAKAAAAVVVSFLLVMILQAMLVGALFPAALYHGSTAGTHAAGFWRIVSFLGLRSGALAAGAALLGFSLGAIGRNTAASLGVGFFYVAIVEGAIIGNFVAKARPWLLVRNAVVFINYERVAAIGNRTPHQATLIVFGYAIAIFLIALIVTRARDVN
ncbi:MAG TPA: ABC transporter permease subunit [Actinomycetota bacterium]|nr:ABC transporter permease subunit [Actinomycetota bacterium]